MRARPGNIIFLLTVLLLAGSTALAQHLVEDIRDPEQHFLYAAGLMQREFYDLAQPQLQQFLERYPEHTRAREVHKLLVHCCHAQKKTAETLAAIENFRRKWPEDPLNEQLLTIKAAIYFAQKDYPTASECFQELQKSKDTQRAESALYHLGQCHLALNRPDEALAAFKTLAGRPLNGDFPYRPYAAYYVAKKALDQGDLDSAAALFTKIAAGEKIPDNIKEDTLIRLADLYFGRQDYQHALQFYDECLVFFPNRPANQYIRLQRVFCFYQLQEFEKVVDNAADWRKRFPDSGNFELDVVQGDSLCELKRYEEALPLYWRSGLNQTTPAVHRRHCLLQALDCLNSLQRYDELLQRGQELLQEFPNLAEKGGVLFKMGQAASHLQDLVRAEELYRQALELYIGETNNYLVVANALLHCLERTKKWSEGAAVSRRISEKIASEHQAAYRLQAATMSAQLPDWPAVREDCRYILKNFPSAGGGIKEDALQLLANASIALRDYPEAKLHLIELQKTARAELQGRIAILLAEVLLSLNDSPAAAAVLEQARTLSHLLPEEKLEALVLLMRVRLSQNNIEAANSLSEEILAWKGAETSPLVSALIWLEIGVCQRQKGKFTGAVAAFRHAYAQASEPQLRNRVAVHLGEIYLHLEQFAEAEKILNETIAGNVRENYASSQELYSLLAEASYAMQHYDQAFAAVEKCFSAGEGGNLRADTRARWIMARLLFEVEKDPTNALPYSIRCFVLADDELYSPKAMELAIRISLALGKEQDARATWSELQQKYPAAAAALQNTPPMQGW